MESEQKIGIIILAAGASRRMGRAKQLLMVDGESMVERVVRLALAADAQQVLLVVGARAGSVMRPVSSENVRIVVNPQWEEGMSTSVRAGVKEALKMEPSLDGLLFLVIDQPYVTTGLLNGLIRSFREKKADMVASDYGDTLGVPVLFGPYFFEELLQLEGDKGARALLQKYPDRVATVPFPKGNIDLDTPDDLRSYLEEQ